MTECMGTDSCGSEGGVTVADKGVGAGRWRSERRGRDLSGT